MIVGHQRSNVVVMTTRMQADKDRAWGSIVEVIRELSGFKGSTCLVEHLGKFYIVSLTGACCYGPKTFVYPSNEQGEVASWMAVAGGMGMTRDEAISDLMTVIERSDS